jgi:hypothetical protein
MVFRPVASSIDPTGHFAVRDLAYYFTKHQFLTHSPSLYVVIYP